MADGTPDQPDVDTSAASEGTSHTQAQVDELVEKGKRDALAAAGRTTQSLQERETAVVAAQARVDSERTAWEQERDEREEAAVGDNPDAFKAYRDRKAGERAERDLSKLQRDFAVEKSALETREVALRDRENLSLATTITAGSEVTAADLVELTDGSEDKMKKLFAILGNGTTATRADGSTVNIDSGDNSGGQSFEDIQNAYIKDPDGPVAKRYEEMRLARGL